MTTEVDGITVFHADSLASKEGHPHIRIKLRKVLFWRWLELEGAKAIPIYN